MLCLPHVQSSRIPVLGLRRLTSPPATQALPQGSQPQHCRFDPQEAHRNTPGRIATVCLARMGMGTNWDRINLTDIQPVAGAKRDDECPRSQRTPEDSTRRHRRARATTCTSALLRASGGARAEAPALAIPETALATTARGSDAIAEGSAEASLANGRRKGRCLGPGAVASFATRAPRTPCEASKAHASESLRHLLLLSRGPALTCAMGRSPRPPCDARFVSAGRLSLKLSAVTPWPPPALRANTRRSCAGPTTRIRSRRGSRNSSVARHPVCGQTDEERRTGGTTLGFGRFLLDRLAHHLRATQCRGWF